MVQKVIFREFFKLERKLVKINKEQQLQSFHLVLDWRWNFWCFVGFAVISLPFLTTSDKPLFVVASGSRWTLLLSYIPISIALPTTLLLYVIVILIGLSIWRSSQLRFSKPASLLNSFKFLGLACILVSLINLRDATLVKKEVSSDVPQLQLLDRIVAYISAIPDAFYTGHFLCLIDIFFVIWIGLLLYSKVASRFILVELNALYEKLPEESQHQIDVAILKNSTPSWEWRHVIDIPYAFFLNAISVAMFRARQDRSALRHNLGFIVWYLAPIYIPLLALLIAPFCIDSILPAICKPVSGDPPKFFACNLKAIKLCFAEAMILWSIWATTYYLMLSRRHFTRLEVESIYANKAYGLDENSGLLQMNKYFDGNGLTIAGLFVLSIMPVYFDYIGLFG